MTQLGYFHQRFSPFRKRVFVFTQSLAELDTGSHQTVSRHNSWEREETDQPRSVFPKYAMMENDNRSPLYRAGRPRHHNGVCVCLSQLLLFSLAFAECHFLQLGVRNGAICPKQPPMFGSVAFFALANGKVVYWVVYVLMYTSLGCFLA